MHVEPPGKFGLTPREFGVHYLMIVLSILTALGLEQLLSTYHHAEAAHAAKARILAEIAQNRSEVATVRKSNGDGLSAIRAARTALLGDIKDSHVSPERLSALLKQVGPHFILESPSLRRDAWEAAIADQSVTYLDGADLRRFSEIYSAERDVVELTHVLFSNDWTTIGSDLTLAGELGRLDADQMARVLTRYVLVSASLDATLGQLQTLLDGATAKPGEVRAVAAH